jgi:hypothetical protein
MYKEGAHRHPLGCNRHLEVPFPNYILMNILIT